MSCKIFLLKTENFSTYLQRVMTFLSPESFIKFQHSGRLNPLKFSKFQDFIKLFEQTIYNIGRIPFIYPDLRRLLSIFRIIRVKSQLAVLLTSFFYTSEVVRVLRWFTFYMEPLVNITDYLLLISMSLFVYISLFSLWIERLKVCCLFTYRISTI